MSPTENSIFVSSGQVGFNTQIKKPPRFVFQPKPDITTYELAQVVQFIMEFWGAGYTHDLEAKYQEIGTASRHLLRVES